MKGTANTPPKLTMIFEQIPLGPMQNFSYLIGCSKTRECAIVDPAWDSKILEDAAKKHKLTIKKILVTHTDYDHINAVEQLFKDTKAPVYVHTLGVNDIKARNVSDVIAIDEGSEIKVGTIPISVIYTPGHKPTNVCFILDKKIITGDTLFVEGCGRVDMPGGNIKKQWDSLQRLKKMDDDMGVYPGHDYGSLPHSTIGYEKKHNPYLLSGSFEEFLGRR